jgi:cell division initiation protein
MKITAQDIEQQRFKRTMRGYDPREVDAFLRVAAAELQRITLEREDVKTELVSVRAELGETRERERTLQGAIAAAERIAEQMRDEGQRDAETIMEEARMRSDRMIENAQRELADLEREISRLRIERETFENRLRLAVDEHRRLLDLRQDRSRAESLGDNIKSFQRPRAGAED